MPDNIDVTRDAKPMPQAPVDPAVRIPDSVRRAAAAADAHYAAPQAPPPAPEPAPAPVEPPAPEPAPVTATVTPEPVPVADPPVDPAPEKPVDWERRYKAMKGRYDKLEQTKTSMQEQMAAMGEELSRVLNQPGQIELPKPLVTPADVEQYGTELIDTIRRVAHDVVAPELETVKQRTEQLDKRTTTTARAAFYSAMDAGCADWRAINRDADFLAWLRLPDVYSGRLRQVLLDDAVKAADAPRALAFFLGFQSEAATGSRAEPSPPVEPHPAPRTAATTLEALAAPGRAKPAGGNAPSPIADEIITRAQISQFYRDARNGKYSAADKAALEARIWAAQRAGRVQ